MTQANITRTQRNCANIADRIFSINSDILYKPYCDLIRLRDVNTGHALLHRQLTAIMESLHAPCGKPNELRAILH